MWTGGIKIDFMNGFLTRLKCILLAGLFTVSRFVSLAFVRSFFSSDWYCFFNNGMDSDLYYISFFSSFFFSFFERSDLNEVIVREIIAATGGCLEKYSLFYLCIIVALLYFSSLWFLMCLLRNSLWFIEFIIRTYNIFCFWD